MLSDQTQLTIATKSFATACPTFCHFAHIWWWSYYMWMRPAVLESQPYQLGLQTLSWASRGHLLGFIVISEKPDKTSKTLFWHSLIIQCLVEEWHFEGLLSRPLAPLLLLSPSNPTQHICLFPPSFKSFLSFPIFPWALSLCFLAGNIHFHTGSSCSDKKKLSLFEAGQ